MHTGSHTDQVGSLLRPPQLLAARAAAQRGDISPHDLRAREDAAIAPVMRRLEDLGLPVNDGELRRSVYLEHLVTLFDPAAFQYSHDLPWHDPDGAPAPDEILQRRAPVVVGPLTRSGRHIVDDEVRYLIEHTTAAHAKTTLPSPAHLAVWGWAQPTAATYPTPADLLHAAGTVFNAEAASIAAAGVGYLQVDNPALAQLTDRRVQAQLTGRGIAADQLLGQVIDADNQLLRAAKHANPNLTTGLHLCRGNAGPYRISDDGYNLLAEALFPTTEADRVLLEFASDMPDRYAFLRHVRPDTMVVLGLVSTRSAEPDDADDLRRAIDEAARYLSRGLDQLALTTQCGFASIALGNPLSEADQWAKLQLVVDVAAKVWGS